MLFCTKNVYFCTPRPTLSQTVKISWNFIKNLFVGSVTIHVGPGWNWDACRCNSSVFESLQWTVRPSSTPATAGATPERCLSKIMRSHGKLTKSRKTMIFLCGKLRRKIKENNQVYTRPFEILRTFILELLRFWENGRERDKMKKPTGWNLPDQNVPKVFFSRFFFVY